jgi:hypothetical protein
MQTITSSGGEKRYIIPGGIARRTEFARMKTRTTGATDSNKATSKWEAISDSALLTKAQKVIDSRGFKDWESFCKDYRGIAFEIRIRELDENELKFQREEIAKPVIVVSPSIESQTDSKIKGTAGIH